MPSFPYNVYGAAGLLAFAVAFFSLPLWIRVARRAGLIDDPGHRKIHREPVPLAGGLAVGTALLVVIAVGALAVLFAGHAGAAAGSLRHGFDRRWPQLLALLAAAGMMLALGLWDDRAELAPGPKFLGQALSAALVAGAGIRITLFVQSDVFSFLVTVLWILALTNAFNFMDNMNGLCAGLALIAAWSLAWAAAAAGQYLVAALAFAITGALAGFLPFNFPRGAVFLGDAGSHLVGFLIAVLAILPHFYRGTHPNPWVVASPLVVLAVPLVDLAWVCALRTWRRTPVWIGDTNHLSHQLVRRGFSTTRAVLGLWLAAAAAGWLGMRLASY